MTVGDFVSEIPDLPEPVVGFRKWTRMTNGDLAGWSNDIWVPGEDKEARCIKLTGWPAAYAFGSQPMNPWDESSMDPCGVSPSPNGDNHAGMGCGIYAYRDAETLAKNVRLVGSNPNVIVGLVLLWGNVYEHEVGWRSQFGAIHSIFRLDGLHDIAASEKYKVPLIDFPLSDDMTMDLFAKNAREKIVSGLAAYGGWSPKVPTWKTGKKDG